MNKTVTLKLLNPVLAVLLRNQPLSGLLYITSTWNTSKV